MGTAPKQIPKGAKGTVSVESVPGRGLRLRWRHAGKRYVLALGIPDSKVNQRVAQQKATQIELDMASGNFDGTLSKYRTQGQSYVALSVLSLFEKFMNKKSYEVLPRSLEKYRATLSYLSQHFGQQSAISLGEPEVERFYAWLGSHEISEIVFRERLTLISAAWDWAVKQSLVEKNPWSELPRRVKVPPKQLPHPFTKEEISQIIDAFRQDIHYSYYSDYVEFLFGTGCRTSEAIGLRWKHVSDDCGSVWIGESLTRNVRKSTKTNRARTVTLPESLQGMLQRRKSSAVDPEQLVFTALRGGSIDDHNFRNRAWQKILSDLNIEYRKPYITRHTLISHALDLGYSPVMVAQLTGHDVQTLYENYAGSVASRPRLPELL